MLKVFVRTQNPLKNLRILKTCNMLVSNILTKQYYHRTKQNNTYRKTRILGTKLHVFLTLSKHCDFSHYNTNIQLIFLDI